MELDEIKNFFSKDPKIKYPSEVFTTAALIQSGKVFPITTSINGYIIPGLFVTCTSEIYDYFNIGFPPPRPALKYRMVDMNQNFYAMEVMLYFENDRVMKLHLDPNNKLTQHYLKMGLKNKIISFHFFNQDNHQLVDSITNLDEEKTEWFERNYKLAKKLKSNKKYHLLSNLIEEKHMDTGSERLFKFHNITNQNLLFEKSDKHIIRTDVNYHYDNPE